MAAWRNLAVVPVLLAIIQPAWGQTYALSENSRAGDCFRHIIVVIVSGGMACTRMHHHAGGFVDHRERIVLIDNIERNIFRCGF